MPGGTFALTTGIAMNPGYPSFSRRGDDRIAALRARIRRIEGMGRDGTGAGVLAFGIDEIDAGLPGGGLARGALHEIIAGDAGAATAFCAVLLGRMPQSAAGAQGGLVLWCLRQRVLDAGEPCGPGLARFGLAPKRVLAARVRRDAEALWAMEEGLRCRALAAVVGEVAKIGLTQSRRLQLAAAAGGVTAFLLRPATDSPAPSAAATRWRIDTAPGGGTAQAPGNALWRVALFRCRGGVSNRWLMEWCDETGDLAVAAPVRDRPAYPREACMAE